ncbi:hypothetical protein FIC_01964 [Flavobacteriaceae bacterium 3519-10]|nr:hypothetical protein FIC_01964 [Flavobacteriaceae bacterium 3519-10]
MVKLCDLESEKKVMNSKVKNFIDEACWKTVS